MTGMACVLISTGMKKELQLLRDEIKTIASQIHKKIKSKYCDLTYMTSMKTTLDWVKNFVAKVEFE